MTKILEYGSYVYEVTDDLSQINVGDFCLLDGCAFTVGDLKLLNESIRPTGLVKILKFYDKPHRRIYYMCSDLVQEPADSEPVA
jgi:hypothetical protein